MANIKRIFSSFRIKVTLAIIFSLFFVMALSNLIIYRFSINSQFMQLRDQLKIIAQTAALSIDPGLLSGVPLTKEGVNSNQYKLISAQLQKIKRVNPSLEYVYTLVPSDKASAWRFIVDPNPDSSSKRRNTPTAYPGDTYDASRFPAMTKAVLGPSADEKIMSDEWGVTLSGYAPIFDKNNKVIAVLGVDMAAQDVYAMRRQINDRAIFIFLLGIIVSIILGLFISSRVTKRIEKLVEGTRRIAGNDFDYKVEVMGHDEVSELADSFNKMALSLRDSRKMLQDYFYRIVQSLIRILEAKDPYTQGHSERVAEYAFRTALEMGLPLEKCDSIKKAAQLHDIGKLAIEEAILDKNGPLNDAEWKIIRGHPLVGENALKPVLFDEEMLSIIRSHHERFDGKGYPDGLAGSNISIFAQIVSVADAYDAMTSTRAYRPALSVENAIKELKNNCGLQLSAQVVDAFLKVLRAGKTA